MTCIQNSQTSQGYIFRYLQHFATKLCNFNNFIRHFSAVVTVKDFVGAAWIKFSLSRELSIVNVLAVNKAILVPRVSHLRYKPGNPQVFHQVVSGLLLGFTHVIRLVLGSQAKSEHGYRIELITCHSY